MSSQIRAINRRSPVSQRKSASPALPAFSRAPSAVSSPPIRSAPVAIIATSRRLQLFRFVRPVAGALAQRLRQRAFELLVFNLIARLQGRIVALSPRHRDPLAPGSSCLAIAEIAFSAAASMDSPAGRAAAATSTAVPSSCHGENHVFPGGKIMEEVAA